MHALLVLAPPNKSSLTHSVAAQIANGLATSGPAILLKSPTLQQKDSTRASLRSILPSNCGKCHPPPM
jgi:hypothetical protein